MKNKLKYLVTFWMNLFGGACKTPTKYAIGDFDKNGYI